jgi:hypothetical protein
MTVLSFLGKHEPLTLCYRHSRYGDHPTGACRLARSAGLDAGYHAGWGICDGRYLPPKYADKVRRPCNCEPSTWTQGA